MTWPHPYHGRFVFRIGRDLHIQSSHQNMLFEFNRNYEAISYRFRDFIAYFPKIKEVTWQWPRLFQGQFVVRRLELCMINMYTKFEVSSSSRYIKFEMSTITCNEEMTGNAKCKILVLSHPLGDLGVTYTVHLWLAGKRVVDFLLVLIEFFLLALMAAAILSEICRNQRFLKGWVILGANYW